MQINRSVRQALFAPEVQTETSEDSIQYMNMAPCLDTRLSLFRADACVVEANTARQPDKILLHVNIIGIPIESSATAKRIDGAHPIGVTPVYSPESAYDGEGANLIRLAGYRAIEVTYSGSGSAMFLTSGKHQELLIEGDCVSNNAGKILIPKDNIIYTKPFAYQPTTCLEEKWRRDPSCWALDFPICEGRRNVPIAASLHAFGGTWSSELNPKDIEQVYFQISNSGGKTHIHPTKSSFWQADDINPYTKFIDIDGRGLVCWDEVSPEQSFSLEQAVTNGFASISAVDESGETSIYKSSQILRSVVNTKTFDMYFLRMEQT
ncbi:MAG: hypothetical protein LBI30_01835 [Holosporales bacterium]|jgi:hypothetical protein|nr:hypothetical protein [Holosporales bacterium]